MLDSIFSQLNSTDVPDGNQQSEINLEDGQNPEEEKANFAADTFAKFGLNMDLFNPNATEEDSGLESQRTNNAKPPNCKVEALLNKIPDFSFLTDDKLAMDELFL